MTRRIDVLHRISHVCLRHVRTALAFAVTATVAFGTLAFAAEKIEVPSEMNAFRDLIGEWRGVGQVRRGSARGAWKESAEWRYDFAETTPRIVLDVSDGQHVKQLIVSKDGDEVLAALHQPDGQVVPLAVDIDAKSMVFSSAQSDAANYRLTLRMLNEKRTTLLIESQKPGARSYYRLGEVGYTRSGTRLASSGSNGPECIVTGGKGTIQVSHKGKTYYVCCTGCKQAFEADPDAIIADAANRNAEN